MSEMRFPRWLAAIGVVGGVGIAIGLPYFVLSLGQDLGGARVVIIILALIGGCSLAAISAVVGITIPSAISGGISVGEEGVSLRGMPNCCVPEQKAERDEPATEADPST